MNPNVRPSARTWKLLLVLLSAVLGFSGLAQAQLDIPGPPTNLVANVSVPEQLTLSWTDNSTFEQFWQVQASSDGGASWGILEDQIASTNPAGTGGTVSRSYVIFPGLTYRVRATWGVPATYASGYSNSVLGATTMSPPTNLTLNNSTPERVVLNWTDNSQINGNYEIQYRFVGDTNWVTLDYVGGNIITYTLNSVPPFAIQFRVRATSGAGPNYFSAFSSEPSTTTLIAPPTGLTGSPAGEGKFNIGWADNSVVEGNYELQFRIKTTGNTNTFQPYTFYPMGTTDTTAPIDNTTSTVSHTNQTIEAGNTYEFRVRATRGSNAEIQSTFSSTIEIIVPFNAPTNVVATPVSDRQINFTWTDNSAVEDGYVIYCKLPSESASQYRIATFVGPNVTSASLRAMDSNSSLPFSADQNYDFQVAAYDGNTLSTRVTLSARTRDGVVSDLSPPMFVNEAFSFLVNFTTGQGSISDSSFTGTLPPGITYNPTTRILSGTPTARGAFKPTLNVSWSNGYSTTYTMHLRPTFRPARPVVATPVTAQNLSLGSSVNLSLASTFADPDTESALSLAIPGSDGTPSGRSLTIILNDTVTPDTVANFRYYLNAPNGYVNSIFHRLVSSFVLQGGAFKSSNPPDNGFVSVPKQPAVLNEPGLTNGYGTLAMAKQAGNPNSATTDFFFNLSDNAGNLDTQNDGFTVFGRVAVPSQSLMNTLGLLPVSSTAYNVLFDPVVVSTTLTSGSVTAVPASFTGLLVGQSVSGTGIPANTVVTAINGTTNITLSNAATTTSASQLTFGSATTFGELPHNAGSAPTTVTPSQLLRINGFTDNIPVLHSHSATSSDTNVVTASVTGTSLTLTPVAPGTTTVSLQVTDLDGNQLLVPLSFNVTVTNSLAAWATANSLPSGQDGPTDDPDFDGRNNLLEYALLSGPSAPNSQAEPTLGSSNDAGAIKATLAFKVRKLAGITYTVEGASSLGGPWTTIWTTADGLSDDNIITNVDQPDHNFIIVRDSVAHDANTPRFLRLRVTLP